MILRCIKREGSISVPGYGALRFGQEINVPLEKALLFVDPEQGLIFAEALPRTTVLAATPSNMVEVPDKAESFPTNVSAEIAAMPLKLTRKQAERIAELLDFSAEAFEAMHKAGRFPAAKKLGAAPSSPWQFDRTEVVSVLTQMRLRREG